MINFLKNNWLALLGALAWLPIIIDMVINLFRKIHCVYLDRHFIYNAKHTFYSNGVKQNQEGMILILALNLFVYKKPFFPKEIRCNIVLKNGAKHSATLYEGSLGYTDTERPPQTHVFVFSDNVNINLNRAIFSDQDNIRVLPFFFENLNMSNDENIKSIEIEFAGRLFKRKKKIKNVDCKKVNYLSGFDKIV